MDIIKDLPEEESINAGIKNPNPDSNGPIKRVCQIVALGVINLVIGLVNARSDILEYLGQVGWLKNNSKKKNIVMLGQEY